NHLWVFFYFFLNKPKTTENFEKNVFSFVFVIQFCK
ncbi:unnamed protein product, partial [Staurois parvus]